ncbi:13454_t:CDS:2 [Gigaspora margarita]|uniref:13454_t:CDS:1 n=1 Tax=Gigaspora margarita TaxID=4874 RepID=A0ABN7UD75_GIGMA|nr:13454_t:CDS:2 [Gigaspora margarita]
MEQNKDKLFYYLTFNSSTKEFECISSSENNSRSQAAIFGQITLFGSVAGLFFNIAVYGVTSKLDIKTTYKDQIIAFLGKQRLYIKIKDNEVEDDKDINIKDDKVEDDKDINIVVKDNEVKNIKTFINDIQNIYLNFKTKRFDNKIFWETVLKLCKKECMPELNKWYKLEGKNDKSRKSNSDFMPELNKWYKLEGKNDKSRKSNYDFIRAILYDLKKQELNEKTEKLMAEKLLECGKIYVDILEAGLFQYLIYSHRSYKEHKNELTKKTLNKFQDLLNHSDLNLILNKEGNSSEENTKKEDLKEDEMKKIGEHTKQLRKFLGKSESPQWEVIYSIPEFKYLEEINDKKLKKIKVEF